MNTLLRARPMLPVLVAGLFWAGWIDGGTMQLGFRPQTSIRIEGTSTLHAFTCNAALVSGAMEISSASADAPDAFRGLSAVKVEVPVGKIDCGNGTMDKKMRQALKESDAPMVSYSLTGLDVRGDADDQGFYLLQTKGRLSIAGTEKIIEMEVRGSQIGENTFKFVGSKKIKMSEFGVKPPSAMMGAVKTGDEVTVHFEVIAGS